VALLGDRYMENQEDGERLPATGFLWLQRGFVLKNPVPEILAGLGLRATNGVFGVFISTAEKFLKMIIWVIWINLTTSITTKKYFQRPKKTIKTPNTPFCYPTGRDRCLTASG